MDVVKDLAMRLSWVASVGLSPVTSVVIGERREDTEEEVV